MTAAQALRERVRRGGFRGLTVGQAQGFDVTCFEMVTAKDGAAAEKISSSRIRTALKNADPRQAARLLGRWWAVEARVETLVARLQSPR